jgi:hypothetical protein
MHIRLAGQRLFSTLSAKQTGGTQAGIGQCRPAFKQRQN